MAATKAVPKAAALAVPVAEKAQADMTAAELDRCDAALFAARDGFERAIRLLRRKAADPNPPPGVDAVEQTARLNIEIADLEMKLFRVSQKINAFDAGQLTMAPPDEATVSSISDLAESVGKMTVEAQDADTIVDVAKQLAGSAASLVA